MNLWKVEILLTMCVLINTFVNQKFIYVLWLFFWQMWPIWNPKVLKLNIFLCGISPFHRLFVIFCNQTSFLFVNKVVNETRELFYHLFYSSKIHKGRIINFSAINFRKKNHSKEITCHEVTWFCSINLVI